ncbi:MAG: 30S ribosomal protein S6 [candidate division Zixibacteria bacterium]|nr:30S ribosomal protein S6 [candidate division Zixibacteria bacterium]
MRLYETTFIINPQTDDSSIDHCVQGVADIITNGGGKVVHENRMGTHRMAYQIQKLSQGYYTCIVFEAPKEVLSTLERHYHLDEAFIRNLTVLFEGDVNALYNPKEEPAVDTTHRPPRRERRDGPIGRRETEKPQPDSSKPESKHEESPGAEPPTPAVKEDQTTEESHEPAANEAEPATQEEPSTAETTKVKEAETPAETSPETPAETTRTTAPAKDDYREEEEL